MKIPSIEDMNRIANKRGGECLSKQYINSKTKLRWGCSKGHQWESIQSSVQNGSRCPECASTSYIAESVCRKYFEFF